MMFVRGQRHPISIREESTLFAEEAWLDSRGDGASPRGGP